MRKAKKAMSAMLAVTMLLSLVVVVSAAGEATSYPGAGKYANNTVNFTVEADPAKPVPEGDHRLVTFHIFVESVDKVPIRAFSFNLEPSEGLELAEATKSNAQEANFYYDYPTSGLLHDTNDPDGMYGEFAYSNALSNPRYFAAAGSDEGQGITTKTEVFTIVGKVTQPGTYTLNLTKVVAGDGNTTEGVADQFKKVVTPASVEVGEIMGKAKVSGTVKSYGDASAVVTIKLMRGDEVFAEQSGTGTNTTYSFDAVPTGTYTLKVEKVGHASWTEDVTVEDVDVVKNLTVYLWGDVNGDGRVNSTDALWVRQSSAGGRVLSETQMRTADVNADGRVNSTDALWIRQISAGSRNLMY